MLKMSTGNSTFCSDSQYQANCKKADEEGKKHFPAKSHSNHIRSFHTAHFKDNFGKVRDFIEVVKFGETDVLFLYDTCGNMSLYQKLESDDSG